MEHKGTRSWAGFLLNIQDGDGHVMPRGQRSMTGQKCPLLHCAWQCPLFHSRSPSFNIMKQNSSIRGLHRAGTAQPWEPLPRLVSRLTSQSKSKAPVDGVLLEQNRRLLRPCTSVLCRSRKCWPWGWRVIPQANLKSSVTVWGHVWSGRPAG